MKPDNDAPNGSSSKREESSQNRPKRTFWTSDNIILVALLSVFIGLPLLISLALWLSVAIALPSDWEYYRTTVEFEAEGSEYEIHADFECEPFPYRNYPWSRRGIKYKRKARFVGHALRSGAAVLISSPNACRRDIPKWSPRNPPSRRRQLSLVTPRVLWLNNARRPTVIESYVSAAYFNEPYARIRLNSIAARGIERATQTYPQEQVPWVERLLQKRRRNTALRRRISPNGYLLRPGAHSDFVGFVFVFVPHEVWRADPDAARVLRDVGARNVLSLEQHTKLLRIFTHSSVQSVCSGTGGRFLLRKNRGFNRLSNFVRPIVVKDGRWVVDTKRQGLVIYYRKSDIRKRGLHPTSLIDLWIDDRPVRTGPTHRWQYDRERKLLFAIQRCYF